MPTPRRTARAYYNEIDHKAAAWLRELIAGGHIAPGDVDTRSIEDVQPRDLEGFTQCHFFAGIGGWSYALRLAGWPDDRHVWTGSCPCQPFSAAGKRGGTDDARHLWPQFYRLIGERRPTIIFGEQVASKDGLAWLDIVSTDLERANYAIGAADMCAAGVGAPHIRQRLYFVAESDSKRRDRVDALLRPEPRALPEIAGSSAPRDMADASRARLSLGLEDEQRTENLPTSRARGAADELAESESEQSHRGRDEGRRGRQSTDGRDVGDSRGARAGRNAGTAHCAQGGGACGGFADGHDGSNGAQSASANGDMADADGRNASAEREQRSRQHGQQPENGRVDWSAAEFIPCTDGKARPIEPGTFPLAHGVSGRVGLLRGYGNAIVPQVAAEFVAAYLDTL